MPTQGLKDRGALSIESVGSIKRELVVIWYASGAAGREIIDKNVSKKHRGARLFPLQLEVQIKANCPLLKPTSAMQTPSPATFSITNRCLMEKGHTTNKGFVLLPIREE